MKLGCINSAFTGTKVGYYEGLKKIKDIGFDFIDIFPVFEHKSYEVQKIKDICAEQDLPIINIVAVYPELLSMEEHVRRYAIDTYKKILDTGVHLGCESMLVVFGEYIWEKNVIPPEVQWGFAVDGIREISEYAEKCGMDIVVELEPFVYSLVNDVDTMEKFLNDVNMPNCLANVDIGHLHVQDVAPKEILRLKGKIGHVHLSDNDGTVHNDWPTGRGNADIAGYIKAIHEAGYDGNVSCELEFSPNPDDIVSWVTECYNETAKIMSDLGYRK